MVLVLEVIIPANNGEILKDFKGGSNMIILCILEKSLWVETGLERGSTRAEG